MNIWGYVGQYIRTKLAQNLNFGQKHSVKNLTFGQKSKFGSKNQNLGQK